MDIPRTDLSRVSIGPWASGVIFTARSSWSDVVNLVGRNIHPEAVIGTNSGEERRGKLIAASATALVLKIAEKSVTIAKADIAQVTYVREKPASDSATYADDELTFLKIFDPQLWPYMLHLQGTLSIRLYDKSFPEDDSPGICTGPPRNVLQGNVELTKAPPQ